MPQFVDGRATAFEVAATRGVAQVHRTGTTAPRENAPNADLREVRVRLNILDPLTDERATADAVLDLDLARALWHNLGEILQLQDDD